MAPPPAWLSFRPITYEVGGGKRAGIEVAAADSIPIVEKDVPVSLYGEAVLEKTDSDRRLDSIKVDRSLPEPEWRELEKFAKDLS